MGTGRSLSVSTAPLPHAAVRVFSTSSNKSHETVCLRQTTFQGMSWKVLIKRAKQSHHLFCATNPREKFCSDEHTNIDLYTLWDLIYVGVVNKYKAYVYQ